MNVSLSPKEKKILYSHFVEGKTLQQTATTTFVCRSTVKKVLKKVKEKCDIENSRQLIYFLTKNNLI